MSQNRTFQERFCTGWFIFHYFQVSIKYLFYIIRLVFIRKSNINYHYVGRGGWEVSEVLKLAGLFLQGYR